MMMRQERAKQFMPFDAMKGLQEALRDREERHSRVERHEISEEQQEHNSLVLSQVEKGTKIKLYYYCTFHDIIKDGVVTEINMPFHYLKLNNEKIWFEDIYQIRITDAVSSGRGARSGTYAYEY
jgi:hypothetical protein